MNSQKDLTTPDRRSLGTSPEWLENQLAEVPLSPEVPRDITELVQLALDVARYGYFKYEFYHLAFTLLLFSFEAALREKLGDERRRLKDLIEKAKKENLLPTHFVPDGALEALRLLRNIGAHPKMRTIMPPDVRGYLMTIYLINCIFDSNARKILPPIFARISHAR